MKCFSSDFRALLILSEIVPATFLNFRFTILNFAISEISTIGALINARPECPLGPPRPRIGVRVYNAMRQEASLFRPHLK
jgi:hypothetical protein